MATNTHPDFVGISALIERHAAQVAQFEQWAADGNWQAFHDNHYDWWAFPIDKPSSYAFAYTVYSDEIAQMRQDEAFMQRHRLVAKLLLLSWGWDFKRSEVQILSEGIAKTRHLCC